MAFDLSAVPGIAGITDTALILPLRQTRVIIPRARLHVREILGPCTTYLSVGRKPRVSLPGVIWNVPPEVAFAAAAGRTPTVRVPYWSHGSSRTLGIDCGGTEPVLTRFVSELQQYLDEIGETRDQLEYLAEERRLTDGIEWRAFPDRPAGFGQFDCPMLLQSPAPSPFAAAEIKRRGDVISDGQRLWLEAALYASHSGDAPRFPPSAFALIEVYPTQ